MDTQLNGISLHLIYGDLLTAEVDAIVISATPNLDLQTELGQRLLAVGGAEIETECRAIGHADMGQVVMTTGGNLPARQVIHAVGPYMGMDGERGKLSSAVWNALRLAGEQGFSRLAFTPISIGEFGYPVEACADIMAQKIVDFTFEDYETLQYIAVYVPLESMYAVFRAALQREVTAALDESPS